MDTLNLTSGPFQAPNKGGFKTPILHEIENATSPLIFDWKNKWLKGEEYAYILKHIDLYCETFDMQKLPPKTHPRSIYTEPQDGMIYFVEGNSIGSDFGFPRVEIKKHYRWKKMNFTTDLPKKRPCVTYIVASAVKCGKFIPYSREEGPSFRMHAVILNKDGVQTQKYKNKDAAQNLNCMEDHHSAMSTACSSLTDPVEIEKSESVQDIDQDKNRSKKDSQKNYILCHIRKIDKNYKASKSSGKRENPFDDDEEEEEDEELEIPSESQAMLRKVNSHQEESNSQGKTQTPLREDTNKSTDFSTMQKTVNSEIVNKHISYKSSVANSYGKAPAKLVKPNNSTPKQRYGRENTLNNFVPFQLFSKLMPAQQAKSKTEEKSERNVPTVKRNGYKDELFPQLGKDDFANVDYMKLLTELLNNKN